MFAKYPQNIFRNAQAHILAETCVSRTVTTVSMSSTGGIDSRGHCHAPRNADTLGPKVSRARSLGILTGVAEENAARMYTSIVELTASLWECPRYTSLDGASHDIHI